MRSLRHRLWLALAPALLAACSEPAPAPVERPLTIFAAASTMEFIGTLAQRFPSVVDEPTFGGSSDLARQIADGAPAQVFVSASPRWVDFLVQRGQVFGAPRLVARNRLVMVVAKDLGFEGGTPVDAASLLQVLPTDRRVAIANEGVPGGDYARAALEALRLSDAYAPRLVGLADVRAVLQAVRSGEAAAGFVYATDARAGQMPIAFAFDPALHPPIEILAVAVLNQGPSPRAQDFLDFLGSSQAKELLIELGFEPAP